MFFASIGGGEILWLGGGNFFPRGGKSMLGGRSFYDQIFFLNSDLSFFCSRLRRSQIFLIYYYSFSFMTNPTCANQEAWNNLSYILHLVFR